MTGRSKCAALASPALLLALCLCVANRSAAADPDAPKLDPLTNWEYAQDEFEKVCQLLVDEKPKEASRCLAQSANELAPPYAALANSAWNEISRLPRDKSNLRGVSEYDKAIRPAKLSQICESLGCDLQADSFAAAALKLSPLAYRLNLPGPHRPDDIRTLSQLRTAKAVAITPEDRIQFAMHAIGILWRMKDVKGQTAWENKLEADFPDNERAQFHVTTWRTERATKDRQFDAAIALWEQLMAKFPDSATALAAENERNQIWVQIGPREKSIQASKEFLEHVDQFLAQPRQVRGRTRTIHGAHKAAMRLWEHYESAAKLPEALKYARMATTEYCYEGFCGNDETSQEIQLRFADLLRKVGKCDEALAIAKPLQEWESLNPKNVIASRARALVRQIRVEFPQAKDPAAENE